MTIPQDRLCNFSIIEGLPAGSPKLPDRSVAIVRPVTSRQPTSLERSLAGALIDLLLAIDGLPDDQIDLSIAVKLEEDVGATVHGLSTEDQELFVRIGIALADVADARGRNGDAIREALRDLGLLDTA